MAFAYTPTRLWRRLICRASAANLRRENAREETTDRARLGREGEEAAYWFLRECGMTMVARNYRPEGRLDGGRGEIDLIGWDGDTLVFIEVKTRSSAELQAPEAAVDRDKQRNVKAAARQYLHTARQEKVPVRFDIVSVEMAAHRDQAQPRIVHLRDAF